MQTLTYTTHDKSTWGDGPWQDEPDKKQWQDPATGYPCLIVRNGVGALCGYVGTPPGHPAFKKSYGDVGFDLDVNIQVHGGLTFADFCHTPPNGDHSRGICHLAPNEEKTWWLGFDCAHSMDKVPSLESVLRNNGEAQFPALFQESTYRTWDYVQREVESLALQLKAMEHK